jgi:hypothetical protein
LLQQGCVDTDAQDTPDGALPAGLKLAADGKPPPRPPRIIELGAGNPKNEMSIIEKANDNAVIKYEHSIFP